MGYLGDYSFKEYGGSNREHENPSREREYHIEGHERRSFERDYSGGSHERVSEGKQVQGFERPENGWFGKDYSSDLAREFVFEGFGSREEVEQFLLIYGNGKMGIWGKSFGIQVGYKSGHGFSVSVFLCTPDDLVSFSKKAVPSANILIQAGGPKSNGISATQNSADAKIGAGFAGLALHADTGGGIGAGAGFGPPGINMGPSVEHCIVIKVYDSMAKPASPKTNEPEPLRLRGS